MRDNWVKVRNEYVTTSISQRAISLKYNIPYNTLKQRAVKENWTELREKAQLKIKEKTTQKAIDKIADKTAETMELYAVIKNAILEKVVKGITKNELDSTDLRRYQQIYCDMIDREAESSKDEFENDGFLEQLNNCIDNGLQDDVDMIPDEEE